MLLIWSLRKSSSCAARSLAELNFSACRIPAALAAANSAMHQAREKMAKPASMATTCSKSASVADKNFIMSSNLFTSQPMLAPKSVTGSVSFNTLADLHSQSGYGTPFAQCVAPGIMASHNVRCWLTERAHTQYVKDNLPASRNHCSSWSRSCSRSCEIEPYSSSPNASAQIAATRSRNRLPQLCVTILRGRVGTLPIMTDARAHLCEALCGMIACLTTSAVVCCRASQWSMEVRPRPL
mmetsp:Transcript_70409/g.177490  ORF Transcript_70409/g.177490 Transcript_70409/m.177490 type:complete len:239 (+) Transcript_70409:388-1104(+)